MVHQRFLFQSQIPMFKQILLEKQNHTLSLTSHIPIALKRSLKLQLIKPICHLHQLYNTTMNFIEGMMKTKYGNQVISLCEQTLLSEQTQLIVLIISLELDGCRNGDNGGTKNFNPKSSLYPRFFFFPLGFTIEFGFQSSCACHVTIPLVY